MTCRESAHTCRTAARSRARAIGALDGDDFLLELDGFGALSSAHLSWAASQARDGPLLALIRVRPGGALSASCPLMPDDGGALPSVCSSAAASPRSPVIALVGGGLAEYSGRRASSSSTAAGASSLCLSAAASCAGDGRPLLAIVVGLVELDGGGPLPTVLVGSGVPALGRCGLSLRLPAEARWSPPSLRRAVPHVRRRWDLTERGTNEWIAEVNEGIRQNRRDKDVARVTRLPVTNRDAPPHAERNLRRLFVSFSNN
jgi:hypothetical protein